MVSIGERADKIQKRQLAHKPWKRGMTPAKCFWIVFWAVILETRDPGLHEILSGGTREASGSVIEGLANRFARMIGYYSRDRQAI